MELFKQVTVSQLAQMVEKPLPPERAFQKHDLLGQEIGKKVVEALRDMAYLSPTAQIERITFEPVRELCDALRGRIKLEYR